MFGLYGPFGMEFESGKELAQIFDSIGLKKEGSYYPYFLMVFLVVPLAI